MRVREAREPEVPEEWRALVEAEWRRRWRVAVTGPRASSARAVAAGVLVAALGLGGLAAVEVLRAEASSGTAR